MRRTLLGLLTATAVHGSGIAQENLSPTHADCAGAGAATEVLERLIDRFNARDVEGWDATFHYPHTLLAGGQIRDFSDPSQQAGVIPRLVAQGWRRSEWEDLRVVQCSPSKAHMVGAFLRFDADDNLISRTPALFVVELIEGRWGVTARSML